ncbi:hypothetical protein ACFQRL_14270 [Microbacterium fluvii]|uniref:Secreted protein n=1 Tax=Microbacterium fluvii TaxID=415215 RepID=A0ABW2HI01_9MICO|nr:hypothetical protein [Microbacterium fluvii]MCU4673756.1 hypothetical protein [Microbacterium fluvii]
MGTKSYAIAATVGLALGAGALLAAAASASAPYGIDEYDLDAIQGNAKSSPAQVPLPGNLDPAMLDGGEVDPSTLQSFASSEAAEFHTALNRDGELCLVASVGGKDWAVATSCSTPQQFNEDGIGIRLETPTIAFESYLIPDAVAGKIDFADVDGITTMVNGNLVVVDSAATEAERAAMSDELATAGVTPLEGE